jgi:predicted permease
MLGQLNPAIVMCILAAVMSYMSGMNPALSTAVSREGKGHEFLKALPVSPRTLIYAKLTVGCGLAALGVIGGIWLGKSLTLGAMAGTLAMGAIAVMVLDNQLILILTALICLLMLVHHIPSIRRVFRREEEKLSRIEDISYKFDEKF